MGILPDGSPGAQESDSGGFIWCARMVMRAPGVPIRLQVLPEPGRLHPHDRLGVGAEASEDFVVWWPLT